MARETFELARFGWATPDTLEIDGRFDGITEDEPGDAVLVLRGGDRTHRLQGVAGGDGKTRRDGKWHASFMWQETPGDFDFAQLELGDELLVELPALKLDGEGSDPQLLDVRRRTGSDRLRLHVDLLAARSLLAEAEERLAASEQDLARARADLAAEQAGRAADAERFRLALAEAGATADEEISEARAESSALRARVEELERTGLEAGRLRDRLDQIRLLIAEPVRDEGRDAGGYAVAR
jgi:hypothetical protein